MQLRYKGYMLLGIDYSSLTKQTCLSRFSRPKGQFVLDIMEQSSPCSKQCHTKVFQDIPGCSPAFLLK